MVPDLGTTIQLKPYQCWPEQQGCSTNLHALRIPEWHFCASSSTVLLTHIWPVVSCNFYTRSSIWTSSSSALSHFASVQVIILSVVLALVQVENVWNFHSYLQFIATVLNPILVLHLQIQWAYSVICQLAQQWRYWIAPDPGQTPVETPCDTSSHSGTEPNCSPLHSHLTVFLPDGLTMSNVVTWNSVTDITLMNAK